MKDSYKCVKETYDLFGDTLPILPCPHDAVIKKVKFDENYLIFYFQKNITEHDAVAYIHPECESLIIRYHLVDPDFMTYRMIRHATRLGGRFGRQGYYEVDKKYLLKPSKFSLEYINHMIDCSSIMIRLWRECEIIIDAMVDRVEYCWIEKKK